MFTQAGDIAGDGIFRHGLCLFDCAPMGHATGQGWDQGCVSTLRFGPQHDVVVIASSCHGTSVIVVWGGRRVKAGARSEVQLCAGRLPNPTSRRTGETWGTRRRMPEMQDLDGIILDSVSHDVGQTLVQQFARTGYNARPSTIRDPSKGVDFLS